MTPKDMIPKNMPDNTDTIENTNHNQPDYQQSIQPNIQPNMQDTPPNCLEDTPVLPILYQDEHCVVINKPSGMLVHRSPIDKHETRFVLQTLRNQIGQHVYPVHRLDRPTSGVLLFALTSESAKAFSQQFEKKQVTKTYWAVVRGYMGMINGADADTGRIDYPLSVIRDKIADKDSLAKHEHKQAQPAQTDWKVLATTEQPFQARQRHPTSRYSWLELTPHTGRKHQLRRHVRHIFHPIIGDTTHGDHHQNRAIRTHVGVSRLMLHARHLSFYPLEADNSLSRHAITVTAPIDDDWQVLMDKFGWA